MRKQSRGCKLSRGEILTPARRHEHPIQAITVKLLRYGPSGAERPGVRDHQGVVRDLSSVIPDLDATTLNPQRLASLESLDATRLPVVAGSPKLGPCVAHPGKFIGIALNYTHHATEIGAAIPKKPVVFLKATSALSAPNHPSIHPPHSTQPPLELPLPFL